MLVSQKLLDYTAHMLLAQKKSIEDILAEILAKNPYSTGPQLVALVQKKRQNTTKQAVYTALKSLLKSEVAAKVGHTYFLSRVWLQKLDQLFQTQREKELVRDAIFDLKDGESISYNFPNLLTCDTYWAHVFTLLVEWIPVHCPIFVWMPHQWFVIGRKEVETNIFKQLETRQKHILFTVGGTTPLDVQFKREWQGSLVSTNLTNHSKLSRTYHVHIFDDFLIEVFITPEISSEIDIFYATRAQLISDDIAYFETLISKKSAVRMKISRRQKRSTLLQKQLARNFYIPTSLLPKTDLASAEKMPRSIRS